MDTTKSNGQPIPGASVTVGYTATAGTTAALPANTGRVRVIATTICFIEIGSAPTAVANTGLYLAAGVAEYFDCCPSAKVSAIRLSVDGSIYVTPFV